MLFIVSEFRIIPDEVRNGGGGPRGAVATTTEAEASDNDNDEQHLIRGGNGASAPGIIARYDCDACVTLFFLSNHLFRLRSNCKAGLQTLQHQ